MTVAKTSKQVVGAAFGDPLGHGTFSGYSRNLFLAISRLGCLAATLSTKQLRFLDILSGCLNLAELFSFRRPNLSPNWLWHPSTVEKLSKRVDSDLRRYPVELPVLQIGTHILPTSTEREYFCVTDMTIQQAVSAERFKVRSLRGSQLERANLVQKHIFDGHGKIFCLSEWVRSSIIGDYGQRPDKVLVVGAGANMPPLPPAENKYSSHEVLFVGLDWDRKGGALLVDAFRHVRSLVPDAVLNIVGCTPEISEPGVNVIGVLDRGQDRQRLLMEELYRRANCFCILPEFDPFPNVLLEAQLTSTPVVCLAGGSRGEAVHDGVSGFLIREREASVVAEAVASILLNPDLARRMGSEGRTLVSQRYTWPVVARRILGYVFGARLADSWRSGTA